MKKNKLCSGFTLIELMVALGILAILSLISLANFKNSNLRAKDTQRKSDLNQYRTALEVYYNTNSFYPDHTAKYSVSGFCAVGGDLVNYLQKCPADPTSADPYNYYYRSTADKGTYVLYEKLQLTNEYYYVCSNGKLGTNGSEPTTTNCN